MAITAARFIFTPRPRSRSSPASRSIRVLQRGGFRRMRRTTLPLRAAGGTPPQVGQGAPRPRRVGNRLLVSCEHSGGRGRVHPFKLSRIRQSSSAPSCRVSSGRPGVQCVQQQPVLLRGVRIQASRSRRNTIRRPGDGSATQDTDRPAELRPALLSWWDYGSRPWTAGSIRPSRTTSRRIRARGQFITSQNETERSRPWCPPPGGRHEAGTVRTQPAVPATLTGAASGRRLPQRDPPPCGLHLPVLSDPVRYGAWARTCSRTTRSTCPDAPPRATTLLEDVVYLYRNIRDVTGWDIGYFAVDSRLFPVACRTRGSSTRP